MNKKFVLSGSTIDDKQQFVMLLFVNNVKIEWLLKTCVGVYVAMRAKSSRTILGFVFTEDNQ